MIKDSIVLFNEVFFEYLPVQILKVLYHSYLIIRIFKLKLLKNGLSNQNNRMINFLHVLWQLDSNCQRLGLIFTHKEMRNYLLLALVIFPGVIHKFNQSAQDHFPKLIQF
jgi:hypothetical protein